MIYGYCRISTPKQNIERQVRNIKNEFSDALIIKEIYTATQIYRPEWSKLIQNVKSGDTIIFDSVSRMSRNAEDGIATYEKLFNMGVELRFLKEPHINSETYKRALQNNVAMTGTDVDFILEGVNKYLMTLAKEQIKIAFAQAEKEVADLHQRTREGIQTARLNGKQIGRKRGAKIETQKAVDAKKKIQKYSEDFDGALSDADCIRLIGISRNAYYKYKRELKEI